MRLIIQRVVNASVDVEGKRVSEISKGLLVFLGIGAEDSEVDKDYLIQKLIHLRIFSDNDGKMNLSILDVNGEFLVVSQFTLYADTKKGNRPSFVKSAPPDVARERYEAFLRDLTNQSGLRVATGIFGADMRVNLINDGPVTIWMDSQQR